MTVLFYYDCSFLFSFFFSQFDIKIKLEHLGWQESWQPKQAHQCQGDDSSALFQSANGRSVICLSEASKVLYARQVANMIIIHKGAPADSALLQVNCRAQMSMCSFRRVVKLLEIVPFSLLGLYENGVIQIREKQAEPWGQLGTQQAQHTNNICSFREPPAR